ncbi:ryncolin-1-like [Homarus americanus]|uniref:Ficolin-1-like 10 n=1 Tax=Homarus americanus TaxID=6706 RepID=A0A8J5N2W6_HOMAM|nr:ryncolin-1-like [Homarus americanus]XP_042215971.1 ryncolin-1-like [Homarus americanus]KAG7172226.1 Ficolin-1-like 10 [Homarus americanus]
MVGGVRVVVVVVVMVVSVAGGGRAAAETPSITRTASVPLTTADDHQNSIERTLQAILTTMQENRNQLQSSMRDVIRAARRIQREVAELREDTDLILGQMYKTSCQEVAQDIHENNKGRANEAIEGVYTIKPPKYKPTQVRCELGRGPVGWTVILFRGSGRERFNRTYREYQEGFGDPSDEYWIGNELLHRLTSWRPHQLRVVMEDFTGEKTWVQYNVFSVADSEDNYRLTVGEFDADSAAGDGLKIHNGMKFSTYDKDDDTNEDGNCAQLFGGGGGWWYAKCYNVLPTGRYRLVGGNAYGGIAWYPWRNVKHSLKTMSLLIRPH